MEGEMTGPAERLAIRAVASLGDAGRDIAAVGYSYLMRGMCALTGGQSVSDLRWVALMRPKRVV